MRTVTSKDGTIIAFDQSGKGPAIILVSGAIQHRAIDPGTAQLAALLAQHFTVFHYDRRGRGDSGDIKPYALEREVEDIEALIDEAGGAAHLYGHSSGAALALEAAIRLGNKIKKLARLDLIDEYLPVIHPVVIGNGKPLFEHGKQYRNLELVNVKHNKAGAVRMHYRRAK
jgi:pimeloyl-ACP methyl ester carboxylesterase